jgi:VIT1/CCC1 family predicted Fe2+/Mn2+ transporter
MTETAPRPSPDQDAAAAVRQAAGPSRSQADPKGTLAGRIHRSFLASVGSIVFGMEDGTVSIFGLVFGVAAAAPDSRVVLLAGGTGAVSAAVSMMAGTFLDVESTNDQAAVRAAELKSRYEADPAQEDQAMHRRLVSAGVSESEAETVTGIISRHPESRLKIAAAVDPGADEVTRQSPVVQSLWMFVTDLFAAAVPVIPFALFSLATARFVSLSVTFVLLVGLGIGRGVIGHRRILATIAETIGIAAAAAVAGLAIGKLIS